MKASRDLVNVPFSALRALSPFSMVRGIWVRRGLFGALLQDAIFAKFRHSRFGILWLLIPQFAILAIYIYIFRCIFQMKWSGPVEGSMVDFGLTIYVGIVIYSVVSDTVMGCCGVITGRAHFVKRIPMPLEFFPLSVVVANFLIASAFLLIVTIFVACSGGGGPAVVLFVPLLAPLLLLAAGGGLLSATAGVFFRDIGNILGVFLLVIFFTAPVFYGMESIPPRFRFVAFCNPLTPILVNVRNVLLFHQPVDWILLLWSWVWGLVVCQAGYFGFSLFKGRFADVL